MIKIYQKNRLPHIRPPGATFFVTCRLADSLPRSTIEQLKKELHKAIDAIKKEHQKNNEHKIYEA